MRRVANNVHKHIGSLPATLLVTVFILGFAYSGIVLTKRALAGTAVLRVIPPTSVPLTVHKKKGSNVRRHPLVSNPTPVVGTPQPQPPIAVVSPSSSPAAPVPAANSLVEKGLYADPGGSAASHVAAWTATHGVDAGLQRISTTPMAAWFGGWTNNVRLAVDQYVSAAGQAGKLPVLVAYNIPNRDCGGQSAGGATDAAAYSRWIAGFADGIGKRQVIVILEPDALAASCYSEAQADMVVQAVNTLATSSSARVYIDAGNASWQPSAVIAARLMRAGLGSAAGFSLNVSNFETTTSSLAYGDTVSQLTGGKHYVVDTGRNGNGPAGAGIWCNPAGRALGQVPTLHSNHTLADAYLWIKTIGDSDGNCGPDLAGTRAPAAGVWWPEYALSLARNAGW